MQIFQYLLYTLLLELPVVVWIYRTEWKTALFTDILLNLFTWPLFTVLFDNTGLPLWLLELGVFIMEAIALQLFFSTHVWKAWAASLLANGCSLGVGLLITGNSLF